MLPLLLASTAGTLVGFLAALVVAGFWVSLLVGVGVGLVSCALMVAWRASLSRKPKAAPATSPSVQGDLARDRVA